MAEERRLPQQTTPDGGKRKKRDGIGFALYIFYLILLAATVGIVFTKIVYYQVFWEPEQKIAQPLTPKKDIQKLEPVRGNILDCKGRLLAMSFPVYDIRMDCTVRKAEFARMTEKDSAAAAENRWLAKARSLADALAGELGEKSGDEYYTSIRNARDNGNKYLLITKQVDLGTMQKIKQMPLFREGPNRGGIIIEQRNIRKYPYGSLARRTLGFVRDNSGDLGSEDSNKGLERRFDSVLHGIDGKEVRRVSDGGRIRDYDSTYTKPQDGKDLRITIDIDLQDIADKALREQIQDEEDLDEACLVLMDVKSGAIRAMVNLKRDQNNPAHFAEIYNTAIQRRCEPGSVFKTATLLAAVDDGYIKCLDETIPTNHGVVKNAKMRQDVHILDWEREYKTKEISYLDGFKISSNYVLSTIAVQNYADKPQQFVSKLYSFGLGDSFNFDLDGMAPPFIPDPNKRNRNEPGHWSNTTLGAIGFGYSTMETPLQILTFYNGIANKGRLMKPYLVEDIEYRGDVEIRYGRSVLNSSMCKRSSADTVNRALMAVTEEGTAKVLKNAKCKVAGKTGTSFAAVDGSYSNAEGRKIYQGTFVGYFPAENPKYSIVCQVVSKPTKHQYQGGGIPARAVKTVVNYVADTDPGWRQGLEKTSQVPLMKTEHEISEVDGDNLLTTVPDLRGMGLKDLLYVAENSGLHCEYSGSGHVRSQSPAAGTKVKAGSTVKVIMK
ncbi:MAG: transpeptidase family protein [Bacteroidales bacterium]|nr:transpeptidase family protein [Bacteroidales bacterium]